jgi:hypothetical protein
MRRGKEKGKKQRKWGREEEEEAGKLEVKLDKRKGRGKRK